MGKDKQRGSQSEITSARRTFLANAFMGAGLLASHFTAAGLVVRYLYPARRKDHRRLFVGLKSKLPPGSSFAYEAPGGKTINVVRRTKGFVALSDVCPHLGCRVHWDSRTGEFVCPCHDGHFNAEGVAIAGPPAEMKASLPRYEVIVEENMIFLELRVGS